MPWREGKKRLRGGEKRGNGTKGEKETFTTCGVSVQTRLAARTGTPLRQVPITAASTPR